MFCLCFCCFFLFCFNNARPWRLAHEHARRIYATILFLVLLFSGVFFFSFFGLAATHGSHTAATLPAANYCLPRGHGCGYKNVLVLTGDAWCFCLGLTAVSEGRLVRSGVGGLRGAWSHTTCVVRSHPAHIPWCYTPRRLCPCQLSRHVAGAATGV